MLTHIWDLTSLICLSAAKLYIWWPSSRDPGPWQHLHPILTPVMAARAHTCGLPLHLGNLGIT